jgi:dihydrofolate reductase
MRKIIVGAFVTMDGVMQGAGGPEEGFEHGGWSAPYYDQALDNIVEKQKRPGYDLLLGRQTFEMFASFFPDREDIWPGINDVKKYVVSSSIKDQETVASTWKNSVLLKTVDDIKKLRNSEGTDIQVHGSSKMIQTLLKHNLVDEIWLLIHPLTLGTGNRIFEDGAVPAAFRLVECTATPSGVIAAHYVQAGEVKTGNMGTLEELK